MGKTYTFTSIAGLNKALRTLPKEASATLRKGSLAIAKDIAPKAAGRARQVGGVAKYVAPTIKARSDRVPKIVMGSTALLPGRGGALRDGRAGPTNAKNQTIGNVMWGAEFGSDRFTQFDPWRGNKGDAGYFLWPTVRDESDSIMERYGDALMDAVDAAARKND